MKMTIPNSTPKGFTFELSELSERTQELATRITSGAKFFAFELEHIGSLQAHAAGVTNVR